MRDHTCTDHCTPPTFRYQVSAELTLTVGQRVKFLTDQLGVLLGPDDGQFVGTLGRDFVGQFHGPHPSERLSDWLLVTVPLLAVEPGNDACAELIDQVRRTEGRDARLYVPVHPSQIEPLE